MPSDPLDLDRLERLCAEPVEPREPDDEWPFRECGWCRQSCTLEDQSFDGTVVCHGCAQEIVADQLPLALARIRELEAFVRAYLSDYSASSLRTMTLDDLDTMAVALLAPSPPVGTKGEGVDGG